jgi:hypothetical protein
MRSKDWQWIGGGLFVAACVLRVMIRAQMVGETTSWLILGGFVLVAGGYWLLTRDRYRPYVFEPMRPEELPKDTYKAFDQHTPEFMQLGCGLVGDFRLQYSPRPTFARYFLPPDRRMYGEVGDVDGMFSPSFTTVFEDGRLIETIINPEVESKFDSGSLLWAQAAGSVSIAALYQLHRQAVDAYETNMQVRALAPTAGLLGEFAQYGHRMVWWEMRTFRAGLEEPQPPKAEPLPIA